MKVIQNFLYNIIYQLLVLVIPLLSIPYISRVLGPELVGEYAYSFATTQYFILLGMLGIGIYGSRTIAQYRENQQLLPRKFMEIYIVQATFTLLATLLYFLFFVLGNDNPIYLAQFLFVVANIFDVSWFFMGLEDFKKIVVRNLIVKFSGLICIFLFVKDTNDLIIYAYILSISNLLGHLSIWPYLKDYIQRVDIQFKTLKKHFLGASSLLLPQIAASVYTVLDRTMLGAVSGNYDLGIYDQAQNILRLAMSIIPSLSVVMMPRIANLIVKKDFEQVKKYLESSFLFTNLLSFSMAFGLMAIAPKFVPWFYGDSFLDVIDVFYFSAIMVIAVGGANVIAKQYLIPSEQQGYYTISLIVAASINVLLNFILLPTLGFKGAAISTVVAEFTGFTIQCFFARSFFDFKKIVVPTCKILIASLGMFVVVRFVGNPFPPTISTTILQVASGGISFIVFNHILRVINLYDYFELAKQFIKMNRSK